MAVNMAKLREMSESQLRELNGAIVTVIRERQTMRQRSEMGRFMVGGKAQFTCSRTGRTVLIRIDRLNTKTVSATELSSTGMPIGRTWRVPPSMLSHVLS